ncbi:hypothetical protein JKF63_04625 [Porcisia hertigi]|uniref:WD repeat protein mio zinc-ribbon like domain-containing protein n=1 Tax=Porcisia hertigi TaxID=2761500 RepID=A0A836IT52_9TRYP|nr:hypothetical protein JKF63_04625 [Porcisia hertigi]
MKYFSCQPDSHNAFGSLTNGVLTYFKVDCARYGRVEESGIGAAAEPPTHLKEEGASLKGGTAPQRLGQRFFSPASFSTNHGAEHSAAPHDVQFTTATRIHTQSTLTLPNIFQTTQCCFSMANRTFFGTDMAFIGAANGLLALAVLQEDLLLYVKGKDPTSLREQMQRRQGELFSSPGHCSASLAPAADSTNRMPAFRPPSPSSMVMGLPTLSQGGGGDISSSSLMGSPTIAVMPGRTPLSSRGLGTSSDVARPISSSSHRGEGETDGLYRRDAPSTITWMRDRPLVLVGYTSGCVEWYEVSISAARRQELLDPATKIPYGASVAPSAFTHQNLNRDSCSNRVARVAVGGQKGGMRVELVASCALAEAGALVSSDYFPANGMVVVGSERGILFLFDTNQLEAPLCELRLNTLNVSFLYCHPFLPIVGILSQSVWTGAEELRSLTAAAAEQRRHGNSPTLHSADSYSSIVARSLAGRVDGDMGACVGGSKCDVTSDKRGGDSGGSWHKCTPFSGAASAAAAAQGGLRQGRHVGWCDEAPASPLSGGHVVEALSIDSGAATPFPLCNSAGTVPEVGSVSMLHSGCVLTFVEYRKDPPPRKLSRAWTRAQPPRLSHRLTQVLQHRMEGTAARYGTHYTFSWKFSFDLELVVGNLEEGALRIVRAARIMGRDGGTDAGSVAGKEEREGTAVESERTVSAPVVRTIPATQSCAYQVVQDYAVRLPLHSLVNVEYVSAATVLLSSLDGTAAQTKTEPAPRSTGASGTTAEQSPLQRGIECGQWQGALIGAAVDPRCHLGYSFVSPWEERAAAGVLCRTTNPIWAGLAVVSMPHSGRRHGLGYSDGADHGVGRLDFFGALGGCDGALNALYSPQGPGGAGASPGPGCMHGVCASTRGTAENGYCPQLKENALAAMMLQPFCRDTGASGGMRHGGRYPGESNSSGCSLGGGAVSTSSRWVSSSTTTSVSTQQLHHQRRRRHSRCLRDPRESNSAVSSYPARSTKGEAASSAVYTSDQRVDLHGTLQIGPGNVSYVVVMNAAGELGSVPIEVRAVTAWHEEGSVFVGLGSTLYAADLVSIQGIEELMRRRHAAGFGLSSLANLAAVKKVGGFGSEDVAILFSYLVTLEGVSIVGLSGPVPSLMELLHSSPGARRGATQREAVARMQARLGPAWRAMMEVCVCHENLCCLLVLQMLRWLPSSLTGEVGQPWRSLVKSVTLVDATPVLAENSTNVDIERAVAVEVTHGRYSTAAEVLLRFASRSPSYRAVATLLCRPGEAQPMIRNSDPRVCASFRASLTPWLLVVFHCLCGRCEEARRYQPHGAMAAGEGEGEGRDGAATTQTALPSYLYRHSALPFWDRVALAVVMEAGTPAAFSYVMQDILIPESNPVQALLLQHGIHLRTHAAMQEIVDSTGDFQLGACLFARVGVLTTAAALAFPFLVDAEVSAAVATERAVVTSPAAHSLPFGLARDTEFALASSGYPLGCGVPDCGFGECGDGSDDKCQTRDTVYGCSPFFYLRSSRWGRSSDQPPSAATGDDEVSLEEGVAHTARLVRNSVLPPPAQTPGEVNGLGRWPHPSDPNSVSSSLAPGHLPRDAVFSNDTVAGDCHEGVDDVVSAPICDESDDVDADVPWVWWAAAYRSFLDDEQAFVRRTTFDVECGQLRSCAFVVRGAATATMGLRGRDVTPASTAGIARAGVHDSGYAPLRRIKPLDVEMMGQHHASSLPENPEPMSVAPWTARRGAGAGAGAAAGTTSGGSVRVWRHIPATASSLPLSATPFFAGPYGCGAADVTSVAPQHGSASMRSPKPTNCVCGERHTGTQLIRSLLSLCSTTATRCSVCLEPVRLGTNDVATAFAWCTSCSHGGHAHHLQNWFRTHRRCPVNGCSCHCDEDSNLY